MDFDSDVLDIAIKCLNEVIKNHKNKDESAKAAGTLLDIVKKLVEMKDEWRMPIGCACEPLIAAINSRKLPENVKRKLGLGLVEILAGENRLDYLELLKEGKNVPNEVAIRAIEAANTIANKVMMDGSKDASRGYQLGIIVRGKYSGKERAVGELAAMGDYGQLLRSLKGRNQSIDASVYAQIVTRLSDAALKGVDAEIKAREYSIFGEYVRAPARFRPKLEAALKKAQKAIEALSPSEVEKVYGHTSVYASRSEMRLWPANLRRARCKYNAKNSEEAVKTAQSMIKLIGGLAPKNPLAKDGTLAPSTLRPRTGGAAAPKGTQLAPQMPI